MMNVIGATYPTLPQSALKQLLEKTVPYSVEGETVVFTVEE